MLLSLLNEKEEYCSDSWDFFNTDLNLVPDLYGKRYLAAKR
jgi:hypothetical protein